MADRNNNSNTAKSSAAMKSPFAIEVHNDKNQLEDIVYVKDIALLTKNCPYFTNVVEHSTSNKFRKIDSDPKGRFYKTNLTIPGADANLVSKIVRFFTTTKLRPLDPSLYGYRYIFLTTLKEEFWAELSKDPVPFYEIFSYLLLDEKWIKLFDAYVLENLSHGNVLKVSKLGRFDDELQKYLNKTDKERRDALEKVKNCRSCRRSRSPRRDYGRFSRSTSRSVSRSRSRDRY